MNFGKKGLTRGVAVDRGVSQRAKLLVVAMLSSPAARLVFLAITFAGCAGRDDLDRDRPAAEYHHETGRLQRLAFDSNDDGRNDATGILDGAQVRHIELDTNGNGRVDRWEFYDADGGASKVGLSRQDDGVMDAVAVYGRDQRLLRLEVSTRRDTRFDRIEFYQAGRLARAEEDTDADGAIDKWETYRSNPRNGPGEPPVFVTAVAFDDAAAGRPTRRLVYGPDGQVARVEFDRDGDGSFDDPPNATR